MGAKREPCQNGLQGRPAWTAGHIEKNMGENIGKMVGGEGFEPPTYSV